MNGSSETDTLDRLVRTHLPDMLRLATRLTGRADAAEEIVQDALVRVAAAWESFRGEASFRTWAFRIVINAFRDGLRKRAAESLAVEPLDNRHPGPPEHAMHQEFRRLVAEQISALPPRQREVLVLIAFEGFSRARTADLLGISEQNVHSTLHLARTRLRESLSRYLKDCS